MTVPQVYMLVVAAFAGAAFCAVKLRQACRTVEDAVDRDRTDDVPPQPVPPPPAVDNQPGTHLADLDECELILAYTNELDAGCNRRWDAIAEHRKEEEA